YKRFVQEFQRVGKLGFSLGPSDELVSSLACPRCDCQDGIVAHVSSAGISAKQICGCEGLIPSVGLTQYEVSGMQFLSIIRLFTNYTGQPPLNTGTPKCHEAKVVCPICADRSIVVTEA